MTYSLTWCCRGWRYGLDPSTSGVVASEAERSWEGVFEREFDRLKRPGEDVGVLEAVCDGCIEAGRKEEGDFGRGLKSVWRERSFGGWGSITRCLEGRRYHSPAVIEYASRRAQQPAQGGVSAARGVFKGTSLRGTRAGRTDG